MGLLGSWLAKKLKKRNHRLDIFPYKPCPHPELFGPHEKVLGDLTRHLKLLIKGCGLPQYIGAKFEKAVPDVRFLCVPWGGGRREIVGIQMNPGCHQVSVQWSCTIVSI